MFVEGSAVAEGQLPPSGAELEGAPIEWIEREIGELAAHIAAAMCRWLELVAEFDRRGGHEAWGFHSCGAWVAWRCSIDPRSAREHVRVARSLCDLPLVKEKFGRGELSYSKVRAMTRIATADLEEELVEMARFATAAQLERLMRGYRRSVSRESAEALHRERFLAHHWDEDGCLCVRGRLSPEDGALFLKALEAGRESIRKHSQGGSAEPEPVQAAPPVNNADALMLIADSALAHDPAVRPAGERYQVVVHVDGGALSGNADSQRCELEDGTAICAETARRLACDGSVVPMLHCAKGALDVGPKRRAIPPSMRRALKERDGSCCQFPGCNNREWVDAHHIRHWARGGETKLDNLLLLCGHHHRLVHEGGFGISRRMSGGLVFRRPDGRVIPPVPSSHGRPGEVQARNRLAGLRIGVETAVPLGRGEPVDYGLAVAGLVARAGP
jgi:Domain of unknown function (DUF222)/HNH endonuclease